MTKYVIRYDMGCWRSATDFCEIEIPDDEDPETNPEIQAALSEAHAEAASNISSWYETADDE